MIAVGIDPSLTCTGIAVISEWGVVDTARAKTDAADSSPRARRDRIKLALTRILRQVPASIDLVVIEKPSPRSQLGQHNERVGLYWMLLDQLLPRAEVVEVLPPTRALYATGNGRAEKKDVVASMRAAFPHVAIPDDNVADALALALMGIRHLGWPIDGELTKNHLRAMGTPSWPTERASK